MPGNWLFFESEFQVICAVRGIDFNQFPLNGSHWTQRDSAYHVAYVFEKPQALVLPVHPQQLFPSGGTFTLVPSHVDVMHQGAQIVQIPLTPGQIRQRRERVSFSGQQPILKLF